MNANEHAELKIESSPQNILQIPFLELANSTLPFNNNMYNMTNYNEQYEVLHGLNFNHPSYINQPISFNNYSLLQHLASDNTNDFHNLTPVNVFHSSENLLPNSLLLSSQNPNLFKYNNNLCFYSNTLPTLLPQNQIYEMEQIHFPQNHNEFKEVTVKQEQTIGKLKRNISTVDKTFQCSHCQSKFTRKDELRRHEKIHSGIRTLTCPYCDKTFIRSDHRRTHIRTHTGEKPYSCDICTKCFARSDERTRHLRVHLKDGNKRRKNITNEYSQMESKLKRKEYRNEGSDNLSSTVYAGID